jgi:16S rRNA (guanine966-N2)-methyltransferase
MKKRPRQDPDVENAEPRLRIVGGRHRGRRLAWSGDLRTRPMKDRVREAVFNLLGPRITGKHAIDLFAGTGALGLEAVSRGAATALFFERHFPTADLIRQNIASLQADEACRVVPGDAFVWAPREMPGDEAPWAVFSSPPYDFYISRRDDMLQLIDNLHKHAPAGSLFVVEADERFDFSQLPAAGMWDVRSYPPAVVGILEKQ